MRIALALFAALSLSLPCTALAADQADNQAADRETLFRVSTLPALMQGWYEGFVPVADLAKHGDLGLGTFDSLEGEMVVIDGEVFQVLVDGTVIPAAGGARTPYAAVTFLDPDLVVPLADVADLKDLEARLAKVLPGPNLPCALRLDGEFSYVKTRSVPKQFRPYPPLVEAAKAQQIFEARDITGTIVGFYLPENFSGLGVGGFHLHFISADRHFGGHLLEAKAASLTATLDPTPGMVLTLPTDPAFQDHDYTGHDPNEVEQIER